MMQRVTFLVSSPVSLFFSGHLIVSRMKERCHTLLSLTPGMNPEARKFLEIGADVLSFH